MCFILQQHNQLSAQVCKVTPSCVVPKIGPPTHIPTTNTLTSAWTGSYSFPKADLKWVEDN